MKKHYLKCWPQYFQRVWDGQKTWEMRFNDRDFQVNDILVLEEYCPSKEVFTSRKIEVIVTYVLHGPLFGLSEGHVIMTIRLEDSAKVQ